MLQNWPIRTKLVVILIVPLVALAVLSAIQVRGNVNRVQEAQRTKALAEFSVEANSLINDVQLERLGSHTVTASQYHQPPVALKAARPQVDAALRSFRASEAKLPGGARDALGGLLTTVDTMIGKLKAHRDAIDRQQMDLSGDIAYWDPLVTSLLGLDGAVASGSKDTSVVYGASALVAISQAKEALSQQTGGINRVLFLNDSSALDQTRQEIGQERAWLDQYQATATPSQKQYLTQSVGADSNPNSLIERVSSMRDDMLSAKATGQAPNVNLGDWTTASQLMISKMHDVETKVSEDLIDTASQISTKAVKDSLVSSLAVALILLLSVLISLLVASPMIRQLRRLREGALEVANHRLPEVVERLHKGEPVDLDAEHFPVPATTRDEIGQLAEAFGTVHEVAVRTAVEQAAMRKSIGDTFLNLARRSQALIHRQLKVIDALERKETDPDELEELFRLDHLATRMRRHAEDLIVLSGSKPARGWRRPVPIKDVIRGAVAEVEDYTRVKVLPVGGGAISGHAVGDVIHMLAELIENATSFSPPHTPVHVTGHEVSNGFAIEIEDRGLGMNSSEFKAINDRLENPPPFDLTTSERLGLFVVGRLAERHSIKVRLRTSPYGGTMAIVLIPGPLLRVADDDTPIDAVPGTPAGHDDAREFAAVGRPVASDTEPLDFGAPMLALPPGSPLGGLADEIDPPTTGFGTRSGPPSGTLALPAAAGTLSPDDLPAPPRMTDPAPPIPPMGLEDTGPRAMFGVTPSRPGDDEPLLDDLPVFATVRSSWFIADRPRRQIAGPAAGNDQLLGPSAPGPATSPSYSSPSTAYSAPVTPPQNPLNGSPESRFGVDLPSRTSPRHQQPGAGAPPARPEPFGPVTPAAGYAPGGPARPRPAQAAPTTDVGLPRRMRRANLAPELRRDGPQPVRPPSVVAGPRSPEEIRSMMSSFQSNFGRGLADGQGSSDGDDQRKVT
ncbi:nitrate- and nitrite sensing domain-containing protein [Frankia sp. AgB1.9]|uniref:sensor histidine kinase n=1 Tax=unclassified Frankia TaxID=2632575 RepID=UPI00193346D3|nr:MULTISPECIES: nitrate- and nitrite sensing domain-containing protein [unclassified Frankia]MBL7489812.1 nitrate- and nitrite sensing domain-containing protein [Frankia sp. AgW1.1]MBL7550272.1 nitrate- and nitrite sensing domain-containing protein [Frankia sp. AgB1.9]MBL7623065.1 nitrate- and nitrite sensing domain-containing protein [Frankia sp. AgB1.8]